jgi:hypothetical protein
MTMREADVQLADGRVPGFWTPALPVARQWWCVTAARSPLSEPCQQRPMREGHRAGSLTSCRLKVPARSRTRRRRSRYREHQEGDGGGNGHPHARS